MASVNSYELDGWPKVTQTLDAYMAVRKVWLASTDVDTFITNLASSDGLYPYKPASGATVFKIHIEKMPGSTLTATGGTGMVSYEASVITLWYSTSAPRYWSNIFYVEKILPWKEFHTVSPFDVDNTSILKWTSNAGTDINEDVGVLLASHIYSLDLYRVSSIPAAFYASNGGCNSSAVPCYALGTTYAAQTLLHADPRAERTVKLGGANSWTLHYKWIFRGANGATWNKKWRPESGGSWDTVWRAASTQVIFAPLVDFTALIP